MRHIIVLAAIAALSVPSAIRAENSLVLRPSVLDLNVSPDVFALEKKIEKTRIEQYENHFYPAHCVPKKGEEAGLTFEVCKQMLESVNTAYAALEKTVYAYEVEGGIAKATTPPRLPPPKADAPLAQTTPETPCADSAPAITVMADKIVIRNKYNKIGFYFGRPLRADSPIERMQEAASRIISLEARAPIIIRDVLDPISSSATAKELPGGCVRSADIDELAIRAKRAEVGLVPRAVKMGQLTAWQMRKDKPATADAELTAYVLALEEEADVLAAFAKLTSVEAINAIWLTTPESSRAETAETLSQRLEKLWDMVISDSDPTACGSPEHANSACN